jgi:hypothetical protein
MQHFFLKNLFKSYYIYIMRPLNLFLKTALSTTCFDRPWSSSGDFKNCSVETVVLAWSDIQSLLID